MSQTVSATLTISVNATDAVTDDTIASSGDVMSINESYQTTYNATGGTAPTVGKQWSASLTFVASTPQTFDLTNLTGPRGSVVTFASVRAIYVYNLASTTAFGLKFGNPGANAWSAPFDAATDVYTIPMNSRVVFENADVSAPWTVDSTHKIIKLDPGSNAFGARIVIIGS